MKSSGNYLGRLSITKRGSPLPCHPFRVSSYFEAKSARVADETPLSLLRGTTLILIMTRRWLPRYGDAGKFNVRYVNA
jgi:hypothetical protein